MFELTVHFKHEMIGFLPNIHSNFELSGTCIHIVNEKKLWHENALNTVQKIKAMSKMSKIDQIHLRAVMLGMLGIHSNFELSGTCIHIVNEKKLWHKNPFSGNR